MLIDNKDGRYQGLPELFNIDEGFVAVRAEAIIRESESGEIGRDEARELAIVDAIAVQYPEPVAEPELVPALLVPIPIPEVVPDVALTGEQLFGDPQPEQPSDEEV